MRAFNLIANLDTEVSNEAPDLSDRDRPANQCDGCAAELQVCHQCFMFDDSWLSVFLGEKSTRLDYKLVWDSGYPLQLLIRAWYHALKLDAVRAGRADVVEDLQRGLGFRAPYGILSLVSRE